uniref:Secreted protein n=1 Tax=Solanum lycopersicum TaxID=4081 RepID=A0A3Q7ERT2_SOLLC
MYNRLGACCQLILLLVTANIAGFSMSRPKTLESVARNPMSICTKKCAVFIRIDFGKINEFSSPPII